MLLASVFSDALTTPSSSTSLTVVGYLIVFAVVGFGLTGRSTDGRNGFPFQGATLAPVGRYATVLSSPRLSRSGPLVRSLLTLAAEQSPPTRPRPVGSDGFLRPSERPWWMLLGFGHRPPEPPVTGRAAQTKWWERIRSLIFLAALVAGLGLLLAGFIGGTIFLGGYLLEQAV